MHLSNQAPCGGDDCNDNDARAHPGVMDFVQAVPDHPFPGWLAGDWNCDGHVVREFQGNVSCSAVNLSLGPCSATTGFTDNQPDCGVTDSTFTTCVNLLLNVSCQNGSTGLQTQGCL